MGKCATCAFYNKKYDEACQEYDDVIKIGDDKILHHCPLFDDHIPNGIYYDGENCEFYEKEGGVEHGLQA